MARDFSKKLRTKAAAKYIGSTPATLEYWRWMDKGPVYLKMGGAVWYLESDLDEFMESCRHIPAEMAEAK